MSSLAKPRWDLTQTTTSEDISNMKGIIAFLALTGAAAFAPAPSQTRSTALNAQKPVS